MNKIPTYLFNALRVNLILGGIFVSSFAQADHVINDEAIIVGSICIGVDCANGENFGFDTIRLKENNLRIRFIDSSASASFPTHDWEITVNESANGGKNLFQIQNLTADTKPFTILENAPTNSFYMQSTGNIGLGTTTPTVELEIVDGNSPTVRLSQDATSGFTAQAWDLGGNESNFFIRDATNNALIPFKIQPGAPKNSLFIANDGDIGFETQTPDGMLDIAHPANANNHAVLISPVGNFGINIDNGFVPNTLFEIQGGVGESIFAVSNVGKVGINKVNPNGVIDVYNQARDSLRFTVTDDGKVGVGKVPTAALDIQSTDSSKMVDASSNKVVLIENTSTTEQKRVMLSLVNNGQVGMSFKDTSANPDEWKLQNLNDKFSFVRGTSTNFEIDNNGNIEAPGRICGGGECIGTIASSHGFKENFRAIDTAEILANVSELKISEWNYKKDDYRHKHIGPMSEEFHQKFGFNGDVTDRIANVDIAGVTLAAIQELKKESDLLKKESESKEMEIQTLKAELKQIKEILKAIRKNS